MHLSLQDGWTALVKASEAGHMECVKVLLNKGADVNMQTRVSGVIIHCVHAKGVSLDTKPGHYGRL